jgi:outer membrane lipoprotein LolB
VKAAINVRPFFEQLQTLTRQNVMVLVAVIFMSACSTTPQTPLPPTQLAENIDIRNWYIKGKIGLKDGKEAHSAYLNWLQCGDDYDIRVTGPFGQGAAHLFGNDKLASLETADSQTSHAVNAEQLLSRQLGWSFPVTELLYWLRGIPSPMFSYSIQDQLTSFEQSEWLLSFPRLKTVDNYQLPTKIVASQDPLKITLIVKQWQLQPDCSRL